MVSAGLGRHKSQLAPEELLLWFEYNATNELLYQIAITMPKYSAIFFYIRVFEIRWDAALFRMNILAIAGLLAVWLLFTTFFDIFQCTPVRKFWLLLTPGHCVKANYWDVGISAFSVIMDLYIMLLPLPILWSLHTGRKRKMMLTGFFFCAYS